MKIERYVSMKDFTQNPATALRDAHSQLIALMNADKAAFYLLDPTSF